MLHGGLADHRACRPCVGGLSARHRVITPDLRSSGKSWSAAPLDFDTLADDLAALLDRLGEDSAVIGGLSSGSGVAVRFALRHRERVDGLVLIAPVYAGRECGYTDEQTATFSAMDAVASRVLDEGMEALFPLYAKLPEAFRDRAIAMAAEFDPASVAATCSLIASGAQPFANAAELGSLSVPVLLVRGNDAQHPAEVSDVYAAALAEATVLPATTEGVAEAIAGFCRGLARGR
jgi:pimeloyl-ACP methyl ester carboxylesterase